MKPKQLAPEIMVPTAPHHWQRMKESMINKKILISLRILISSLQILNTSVHAIMKIPLKNIKVVFWLLLLPLELLPLNLKIRKPRAMVRKYSNTLLLTRRATTVWKRAKSDQEVIHSTWLQPLKMMSSNIVEPWLTLITLTMMLLVLTCLLEVQTSKKINACLQSPNLK